MEEFYRIRRLPPYVFEEVNLAKATARNAGADIIDLGMGNPDLPAPAHVIEKLKETLGKPRTDRYSASKGIAGLRRAQAAYYERRFGVKLNPNTQIVTTLGSKEGFANVAQAITAPGDVVLVPDPSSDPRVRLPDGGRRDPLGAFRSDAELFLDARARHRAFDPETDRGGGLLSLKSDRIRRRSRLLQRTGAVREEARHLRAVRSGLR
jgi:bifunctional pyridoxal-dependent enzyme with beta-cystathionase and maltose regulon repressor activities